MDVILTIDGLSLNDRLSTYSLIHEVSYKRVIETLDGVEHPYKGKIRPTINFTLLPSTENEDQELYDVISKMIFNVTYMDKGNEKTRKMRVTSNLEEAFLLMSVDGKRRYKGGNIQLRGL